jgi:purine-binding chemotaxis protein CheW
MTVSERNPQVSAALLFRLCAQLCALPVAQVVENLRPLPLHPLTDAPGFVQGLSIIRGEPLPVIDLAALFGKTRQLARRLVVVKTETRRYALCVEEVLGVREIPQETLQRLPPLLGEAERQGVQSIARLDTDLLFVLNSAHLAPEGLWNTLDKAKP